MNMLEIIWVLIEIGLIYMLLWVILHIEENAEYLGGLLVVTLANTLFIVYYFIEALTTPLW